jgi:hypothetical protein
MEHRDVAEIALAEIEGEVVAQHHEEADIGRLVEAELLLELLDEFRIEPLSAAVFAGHAGIALGGGSIGAAGLAGVRAADAGGGADIGALKLSQHPLHRPAGRELDQDEGQEQHPEQRRGYQQQSPQYIGRHAVLLGQGPRFRLAALAGSIHHVSIIPRSYFGLIAGLPNTSQ